MKRLSRLVTLTVLGIVIAANTVFASAKFTVYSAKDQGYKFYYTVNAGETITDAITVENLSNEGMLVNIFGADGEQTQTGTYTIKTTDKEQFTVGNWIKFNTNQVELKPYEKRNIEFKVQIPEKTPPASYIGGIGVSTSSLGAESSGGAPKLNVVSRVALLTYIDIPGAQNLSYDWTALQHVADVNGSHSFKLKIKNNGNVAVMFHGNIEMLGSPDGNNQDEKTEVDTQELNELSKAEKLKLLDRDKNILPVNDTLLFGGDEIEIPFSWQKKPLYGSYVAKATLEFAEYNIKEGKEINPVTLEKETAFTVIPWNLITMVILFIVLLITIYIGMHVRKRIMVKSALKYVVKGNDTLLSIAKDQKVSWKLLAKINRIKPPYELKDGQTILIPKK